MPAQLGVAPNHQFVLLGCLRATNMTSTVRGRVHRQPALCGGRLLSPGLLPQPRFSGNFLSCPVWEAPRARSPAIAGGGTWWWGGGVEGSHAGTVLDSTAGVSLAPQRTGGHCRVSLSKGSTPTPTPRVLVCFPSCFGRQSLRRGSPWGGMVGRGPVWGPRGSQRAPCPSPWQPLSPWTMSTGK